MLKQKYLLIIIIFIAAILRFYQLGINPPSLTWDEVAWGYNAYSLGIDGKDEFGRFLPYDYLESFGDFKPPVYAYLDIIPVKLFGLNEFAVRFPSAFFGLLTVLVSYFLTLRIFHNSPFSRQYALLTGLLLAVSPWHIVLSRAAFEANVATFFLVSGVYLSLYAIQKKSWSLIFSTICFAASMYTFNTSRIVAPLLALLLIFGFWKSLLKCKKQIIFSFITGLIILFPLIPFLLSDQAKLRFREVNIFTDVSIIKNSNQQISNDGNVWWSKIIHNRRFEYGKEYLNHYFDNLLFNFLFISGDGNPKFSTQSVGQMYLFELPFFIAGILFVFRKREKNWWVIPFWLVLGIIPAATARETPHALRIETILPTVQIFVAYGIVNIFSLLKKHKILKLLFIFYFIFAVFNITYYIEDYYNHYPRTFSGEWQYGYKNANIYINQVKDKYSAIYLTPSFGRPYIYSAFYAHYDPRLLRKQANINREALGFVNILSFDKYYFEKNLIPKNQVKKTLYIDEPNSVPSNSIIRNKFYLLNGELALVAYTL